MQAGYIECYQVIDCHVSLNLNCSHPRQAIYPWSNCLVWYDNNIHM